MAKFIFKEIGSKTEIKEAGQLISKSLRCNYNPDETTQVVYGDVTREDLDKLGEFGYKVKRAKAK